MDFSNFSHLCREAAMQTRLSNLCALILLLGFSPFVIAQSEHQNTSDGAADNQCMSETIACADGANVAWDYCQETPGGNEGDSSTLARCHDLARESFRACLEQFEGCSEAADAAMKSAEGFSLAAGADGAKSDPECEYFCYDDECIDDPELCEEDAPVEPQQQTETRQRPRQRQQPRQQIANACYTPMGACRMMQRIPVGSSCYCYNNYTGAVWGVAR